MSFVNSATKTDMFSKSNQANNHSNILHLNHECDRLKTFEPWTKDIVDKNELAENGFYYVGPGDVVKCIYCGVVIARWGRGDDPLREHMRWSESCPFLLQKLNDVNVPKDPAFVKRLPSSDYVVPIKYQTDDVDEPNRPTHKVVLEGPYAIRHPKYASKQERLKSFENYPKSLNPRPEAISEAGLFYLGTGDHCKCFHCGGALRDWEDDDDPWVEHAKFYGDCEFVRNYRNENFIEQAKLITTASENTSTTDITDNDENETELDDSTMAKCNICLVENLDVIFLPCMHVYACAKCSFSVTHCPVCRQKIVELSKCQVGAGAGRPATPSIWGTGKV